MDSRPTLNPFAAWLWEKMQEHPEIGQVDLARAIGILPSSFSTYLSGQSLPAKWTNIKRLADYFGVDVEMLQEMIKEAQKEDAAVSEILAGVPAEAERIIEMIGRDRTIRPQVKEVLAKIVADEYAAHRRTRESR